jgi:hypothetical protein
MKLNDVLNFSKYFVFIEKIIEKNDFILFLYY